ncbi:MAG: zf-HC2 domain-containing protein [Candidatus Omnitrophica bacterium]|nr:zf-HC2 domain-containing protein [Candidatus Omnitrophota bacterium]
MENFCPDEETLACFIEGRLPEGEKREIERHLEECSRCKEIVRITQLIKANENKGEILEVPQDLIKKIRKMIRDIF